ncbi:MAG: hypothetical protein HY830_12645 [Actinobacteria bacterium]|nr:hypothetical protein [Actinomycetota bacterium]
MLSVEEALAELGRTDTRLVDHARLAWEALSGGGGPETVTQWRVQQFCWFELAAADRLAGRRWPLAEGLAALLDGLGLGRYAGIARSSTTREVLLAADQSNGGGHTLADRASQRSGIHPPDTELVTWRGRCGPVEATLYELVADRLEIAVVLGDLQPGTRGWRDQQAELTLAVLTTPHPAFDDRPPYEALVAERVHRWVRRPRSTTRTGLLAPLERRLLARVDPGMAAPARSLLRPMDWLLTEIHEDGLPLTAAGYLPPRTVARALDELGWRDEIVGPASREVDAYPVLVLRESATRLGLVRRRSGRLVRTQSGRAAVADGRTLWLEVAAGLVGPEDSALATAWEVVLAVLEPGDSVPEQDVRALVQSVVAESGWRLAGRRDPVGVDTAPLFFAVLRELRWLELVEESGALLDRRLQARPGAGDLFRAALRHRVLHTAQG